MVFRKLDYVLVKGGSTRGGNDIYRIGDAYSINAKPNKIVTLDIEISIRGSDNTCVETVSEATESMLNGIVDYQIYRKFGLGLTDLLELFRKEYPEKFI